MNFKKLTAALSAAALFAVAAVPYTAGIKAFADDETAAESAASSEEVTSGDYSYILNDENDDFHYDGEFVEGSIRITKYSGSDTDVVVPDEIDGYTVTAFADDAFADCQAKTLTIPSGLNYIGNSAFFGMSNCTEFKTGSNENYTSRDGVLMNAGGTSVYAYPVGKTETSYIVPNDVNYIGTSAFAYSKLTDVTLPSSLVNIDEWAFAYSSVKKISLPSTTESVEQFAFAYCTDLSDVTLSNSLTYIGSAAFACCSSLKSIDIPNSVTDIGQTAFLGTGLTEVRIPASVTSIGYCAFGYDEDFSADKNFVIYGKKSSQAETYATEKDDENDYENNFTFIADEEETAAADSDKGISLSTKMIITIVLISVIAIAAVVLIVVLVVMKISGKSKKTRKK